MTLCDVWFKRIYWPSPLQCCWAPQGLMLRTADALQVTAEEAEPHATVSGSYTRPVKKPSSQNVFSTMIKSSSSIFYISWISQNWRPHSGQDVSDQRRSGSGSGSGSAHLKICIQLRLCTTFVLSWDSSDEVLHHRRGRWPPAGQTEFNKECSVTLTLVDSTLDSPASGPWRCHEGLETLLIGGQTFAFWWSAGNRKQMTESGNCPKTKSYSYSYLHSNLPQDYCSGLSQSRPRNMMMTPWVVPGQHESLIQDEYQSCADSEKNWLQRWQLHEDSPSCFQKSL